MVNEEKIATRESTHRVVKSPAPLSGTGLFCASYKNNIGMAQSYHQNLNQQTPNNQNNTKSVTTVTELHFFRVV